MRWRFASKNTSSASPQVGSLAVTAPVFVSSSTNRGGLRNTAARVDAACGRAPWGSLPSSPAPASFATCLPAARSTTATCPASGTFTNARCRAGIELEAFRVGSQLLVLPCDGPA